MQTFYIFKLNREYYLLAKKNIDNVYLLLYTIYQQNKKDFLIAYDLFKEICMPINKYFFDEYIYDRLKKDDNYTKFKYTHMYHDYLNNEESKMTINNSSIIIKSNRIDNIFINIIIDIDNLIVCNFKNEYYVLSGINNTKVK